MVPTRLFHFRWRARNSLQFSGDGCCSFPENGPLQQCAKAFLATHSAHDRKSAFHSQRSQAVVNSLKARSVPDSSNRSVNRGETEFVATCRQLRALRVATEAPSQRCLCFPNGSVN